MAEYTEAPDVRDYLTSKGLQLKEAGQNEVHLACVFCREDPAKRGRLYINVGADVDLAGLYYCHKCSASGNLRTLMRHFGDELRDGGPSATDSTLRVLEAACAHYQGSHNERSLSYLTGPKRGLTREAIRDFRLGYAPESEDSLYRHLTATEGFTWDEIKPTGLVVERDGRKRDFFSRKIIIPYLASGSVLQLRAKDAGGKYLTPPGQKGRMFNGMTALRSKDVIVCEGEFDAMVLTQLGFSAVALPGAASFQPEWCTYLDNCRTIYTLFDPDDAGRKGLTKFLDALAGSKFKGKVYTLDLPVFDGMDPGDVDPSWLVAERGWGRSDFDQLIESTLNANSLLVTVRQARAEWELIQGTDGLQLGLGDFDTAIRPGLLPGQVMIPLAKAEPVTNVLPTPDGPRKMGDLQVGDRVFGRNGTPTEITGVYPQGVRECYEVTFADRTSVIVSGDHLWQVQYRYGHDRDWKDEVLSTTELLERGLRKGKEYRFQIPMCEPVQYPEADLPIEPYTLGSLIANGGMTSGTVTLTTPDPEVVERIAIHHEIRERRRPDDVCPAFGLPGLIGNIRDLGLDVLSGSKFIPSEYLQASVAQRHALLQGLMDGDGCAARSNPNAVGYSTTSSRLASDVQELVSSLGGTASLRAYDRSAEGKPVELNLSIMLPDEIAPFHCPRKTQNQKTGRYVRVPRRPIVSIEPAGWLECQCIRVAADDHLYLTNSHGYVTTHNTNSGKTLLLLNIFQRASMMEGQEDMKILFLSLEQTRGDWFERAMRIWNFYNLDCEPEKVADETVSYWENRLMMTDQNRVSEDDFLRSIEDYERIMGTKPDLVAIDYLGYWAQSFGGGSRYEKVTEAVLALKHVTKEVGCPVIAPHQVNRSAEFGTSFQIDQGRESGAVEETADFALSLWAADTLRGADLDSRTGQLGMELGKSRHGGKGNQFSLQFGYLTLVVVPESDVKNARKARAEVPWANTGRIPWREAITAHRTGIPPSGFHAMG